MKLRTWNLTCLALGLGAIFIDVAAYAAWGKHETKRIILVCINSACDCASPAPKKRFVRHAGVCRE